MKFLSAHKNAPRKKQNIAKYRFVDALYRAFFSGDLYIDVIRRWRGFGLLYLLLMFSVMITPYAFREVVAYQNLVQEKLLTPIKKLPPFSIRSGQVYFNSPMPYLVKNNQDEVVGLIDTEGKIKQFPSDLYPETRVLVTKRAIHIRVPSAELFKQKNLPEKQIKSFKFPPNENINFVGSDWLQSTHLEGITRALSLFIYPTAVMLYFGLYLPILFSLGMFGQFVAKFIFKVQLSFQETARLIAVAATPQALIYFMLLASNKVYPGSGLFYLGLLAIYFSFGVLAYRKDSRGMVLQ